MSFLKNSVASSSSSVYGKAGSNSRISADATETGTTNAGGVQSPPSNADSKRDRYNGLLGVFGRGFFAKPVNHSKEESYRYLMALDQ